MSGVIVFDTPETRSLTVREAGDFLVFDTTEARRTLSDQTPGDWILLDPPAPVATVVAAPQDFILLDAQTGFTVQSQTGEDDFIVITTDGPRGLRGQKGDPGEPGDPGIDGNILATWKGEWSDSFAYGAGDVVRHDGSSYVAKIAHTGAQPPDAGVWELLVQKGSKGDVGPVSTVPGPPGSDAYQIAVTQGFVGTRMEWLASLVGPKGDKGDPSTVAGPMGPDAYETAVAAGFVGTRGEWLNSLKTPASGAMLSRATTVLPTSVSGDRKVEFDTIVKVDGDFTADLATHTITVPSSGWYSVEGHIRYNLATTSYSVLSVKDAATDASIIRGTQGDYDNVMEDSVAGVCWLEGGRSYYLSLFSSSSTQYVGSESGANVYFRMALMSTGPRGMSAYEVALGAGFVGTVEDWLESIKGEKGDPGTDATISTISDSDVALPQRGRLDFTDPGFQVEDDAAGDTVRVQTTFVIGNGTRRLTVGNVPPTGPQVGDLWVDTN